jgi:hypothetical protein
VVRISKSICPVVPSEQFSHLDELQHLDLYTC